MAEKILLVEDEDTLAMIVSETLASEGFEVAVARDGLEGIEAFRRIRPDVIIADVMMPALDGFSMVRRIRAVNSDVPVIFLTARSAIDDIEEGFGLGGNDYLKKPFKMRELIVRVKALLRRKHPVDTTVTGTETALGGYRLNPVTRELRYGADVVELTHIEATILAYLAAHAGEAVSSSDLMKLVWNRDDFYNRNSLHGYIHKLRAHLSRDTNVAILNLRGIGYRLIIK